MSNLHTDDDPHQSLVEDPQAQSAKQRNIIISRVVYAVVALCVFGVVAAIVTVLILTYTNPVNKKPFTFDDIFTGKYSPRSYSMQWSPGSVETSGQQAEVFLYMNYSSAISPANVTYTKCDLIQYNSLTNAQAALITYDQLQKADIDCDASYIPSPNNRFVAFMINREKVFRHSILGKYVIYDTVSHTAQNASPHQDKLQKTFSWCTTNKAATNYPFAFVEQNNIFVSALTSSAVMAATSQVTTDGDDEVIFNGVTDWLYEEEVYGGVSTMKWSTDCSRLAFLKLNESLVPTYEWDDYSPDSPYPISKKVRITTPGYPNPIVSTHVYNLGTQTVLDIDLRVGLTPAQTDIYVYDLIWASASSLATVRIPRIQNQKDVLLSDTNTFDAAKVVPSKVVKTDITTTWIQYAAGVVQFLEENLFVDITVDPDNKDGHYHLALYDIAKQTRTFLTSGSYDVVEISSFNTVSKEVFYASTEYGSTNRTIKAVKYDGTKTSRFISKEGNQGYFTASFSPSGAYYQLSYLGPNLPIYTLEQTNPTPGSNASIVLLENSAVKEKIEQNVQLPSVEIKTINNRAGVPLNALFVYPPTYNANSDVKYPCIMRVYGGPGNQLVLNSWNSMHDPLGLYWASLGFVVVTVDSTGTGGRGEKFMTATYKNLGDLESQDQVFAAKYLQGLYFIDGTKLGIWGWSYGGYMTLMSLTHPENDKVFKLGMAVAPVTDWSYYDSAYTERYMQWPAINPEGYKNSSVIQRVVRAEPKCPLLPVQIKANGDAEQAYSHLLLIHGTGDDNVHPLNSYNLMTTLQDRQVQFTNMFYPNKDHSISGGNTRRQLYRLLTNTLQAKLLA